MAEGADRGQHMGGVDTLPAPGLEQAGLHQAVQHQLQQPVGGANLFGQPGPKLAQHRVIESRIFQLRPIAYFQLILVRTASAAARSRRLSASHRLTVDNDAIRLPDSTSST
ncbi:hypothetical protein EHS43_04140 [Streptomyces sp. RP5T]|nr:hypothetical protein EHS43_04140 [Streptomyces sp. RP5T]